MDSWRRGATPIGAHRPSARRACSGHGRPFGLAAGGSLLLAVLLAGVLAACGPSTGSSGSLGTPTLTEVSSPSNNDDPALSWQAVSSAASYELQYGQVADFSGATDESALTATTFKPATALADGTWHWRVRAVGSDGTDGNWATSSFVVDTVAPTLPSSLPADGSSDIAVNTGLQLVFSESMDTSKPPSMAFSPTIPGSVSGPTWSKTSSDNDTASFTLPADLSAGTSYTVTVSGGADLAGNDFAGATITFFTQYANSPTATTSPANGATGVSRSTDIVVTYDQQMDPSVAPTLTVAAGAAFTGYSATPTWSTTAVANDTATFSLTNASNLKLAPGTAYTITMRGGQNVDGTAGPTALFSFTTIDDVPPTVFSISAIGVPASLASVTVVFSESMDTSSAPTLSLSPSAGTPSAPTWKTTTVANDTATFTLGTALQSDTTYTATVSGGKDLAGNAMADATVNFTTQTQYTLSLGTPNTGMINSSPSGINNCGQQQGSCTATFDSGTSVTLTATPNTGYSFSSWGSSGPCSGVSGNTCTFTITANTTVPAPDFTINTYTLTVTVSPSGDGTITSSSPTISCTDSCTYTVNSGASVTLNASDTYVGGYLWSWQAWSGGACSSASSSTCSFTVSADTSVGATFYEPPQ